METASAAAAAVDDDDDDDDDLSLRMLTMDEPRRIVATGEDRQRPLVGVVDVVEPVDVSVVERRAGVTTSC